jgi:hypothetical protein
VDGRSSLGKSLSTYEHPSFSISKGEGFNVHIPYDFELRPPANAQDMYLRATADTAALDVIRRRMGIDGYVRTYMD